MASPDEIRWVLTHEKDYYGMLNVSTSADDATIRRRYYALTLKLHPDKNPNDEHAALACRFVMDAYSVLKDPSRRRVYDAYGAEGISRLDQMGGDIPSFSVMVRTISVFVAALFLRFVGRRFMCLEQLPKLFPFTNEKEDEETTEDDADLTEAERAARRERRREMLFVQRNKRERAKARRFVFTLLLTALVALLCFSLLCGHSHQAREQEATVNSTTPLQPMSVLFHPRFISSTKSVAKPDGVSSEGVPFTFDYGCVPKAAVAAGGVPSPALLTPLSPQSQAAFVDCQRRNQSGSRRITLRRFAGTDDVARVGFYQYLSQRCALESDLAWASRERYEKLATVRRAAPLLTPKSPNQAPRRKFPRRTWRPKFAESFTVADETELFEPSPLCKPLIT